MPALPAQPYILSKPFQCGLSLSFALAPTADLAKALTRLARDFDPRWGMVGLGEPLVRKLGKPVPGLRIFPAMSASGVGVPSTQQPLWMMLTASTQGAIFDVLTRVDRLASPDFVLVDSMPTFIYGTGRDLTGFEDGTENPTGRKAAAAAIVAKGEGMKGSSFVAVQRWLHDLHHFGTLSPARRDALIGRRHGTNEEIESAPRSSHVKRSTQEDFDPPAFMVRRSMPFVAGKQNGLEFISYVARLDTFEIIMRRMAGLDRDGISDALFTFSRPVTGGYYWCPPLRSRRLDLRILGL
jgi:putative iron-dependent peroxidase